MKKYIYCLLLCLLGAAESKAQRTNTLKETGVEKGQVICLVPGQKGYVLSKKPKSAFGELGQALATMTSVEIDGSARLVVSKVNGDKITVSYDGEKYDIENKSLRNFMLADALSAEQNAATERKVREEQQRIADEQSTIQANLSGYYQDLTKFKQDQGSQGPIAVEKNERAYDAAKPFMLFYKNASQPQLATIFDETFVKYPQTTEPADTFGLYRINEQTSFSLINLRTGELAKIDGVESIQYLANLANSTETFTYDGKQSIRDYLFNTPATMKQKVCDALIGEQVMTLTDTKYHTIQSVDMLPNNKYRVNFEDGENFVVGSYDTQCVSVRWYENLNTLAGKKVVFIRDVPILNNNLSNNIYQETLSCYEIYTMEKLEVKKDGNKHVLRLLLDEKEIINGEERQKGIDPWDNKCRLLEAPILKDVDYDYSGYVLYDYVKQNVPSMPASMRQKWQQKNAESKKAAATYFGAGMMKGMDLAAYQKAFSDARLIKSGVTNGKPYKIYQAKGIEAVFIGGKCTDAYPIK